MPSGGRDASKSFDPAVRPHSSLTQAQARRLTDRIRKAADDLWALLKQAHDENAWAALGYASWEQYVRQEFSMTRQRSYQLLDHARAVLEIGRAAGLTTAVDTGPKTSHETGLSERQTRKLRGQVPQVAEAVKAAVKGKPKAKRPAVVREVVEGATAKIDRATEEKVERAYPAEAPAPSKPTAAERWGALLSFRAEFADLVAEIDAQGPTPALVERMSRWVGKVERTRGRAAPSNGSAAAGRREVTPLPKRR